MDENLHSLDEWDDDLKRRYPEAENPKPGFRNYEEAPENVRRFYRENHERQTVEINVELRERFLKLNHRRMGIWQAMEFLNQLQDESDPDTDLSQIEHLLQTAEAIRADGHPDWFVLTGLIHDLGKILCLFGEPQWAVTGDTFPVGCPFEKSVVYSEFFQRNPDSSDHRYNSGYGIYAPKKGLRNVMMSWGHDEYMYHVVKDYLPVKGLAMIRFHSFYAWHKEGGYEWLMDDFDRELLGWVQKFNPYDLYTKSDERPDVAKLRPYYENLISKYFPTAICW